MFSLFLVPLSLDFLPGGGGKKERFIGRWWCKNSVLSPPDGRANSNDKKKFYLGFFFFGQRERERGRGVVYQVLFSFFLLWLAPGKEKLNIDGMASCVGVLGVKKGERKRISILFFFSPLVVKIYI